MSQRQYYGNAGGSNFDNNRGRRGGGFDGGRGGFDGERGGFDGGRSGGRGRGGGGGGGGTSGSKYWPQKRQSLETDGIMVQTNCYELKPKDNADNATINQYSVTIDALVRKRDDEIKDSKYTPIVNDQTPPRRGPFYLVKKTLHTEVISAADDRSTKLSRRILNHCNKKLQEISRPLVVSFC